MLNILEKNSGRISEEDKDRLDLDFTKEELHKAAKAMQAGKSLGLDGTPIAFLPGRNIHTSVIIRNEAIHEVKQSRRDYILLLLDFKKAFDSVNWKFITELLQVYGFGPGFQRFIKAILSTVTSSIIVNGQRSKPASKPKTSIHYSLGFYADDSHVIFRATKEGATFTKALLDVYANTTGLQIQWAKINEVCSSPLYSRLSISGRITVANAVLLSYFWYIIPLWAAELDILEKLEKKTVNFVRSGANLDTRHRAATKIIVQQAKEGGLGLLSLTKQHTAFSARMMRWAFQRGDHPLQMIIRFHVEEANIAAFGVPGSQWIHTPARRRGMNMSTVLLNVFKSWERLKKDITHGELYTLEDWKNVVVWGSAQGSSYGKVRKSSTQARRLLWECDYSKVGDFTNARGDYLATWETRKIMGAEQLLMKKAFINLMGQLKNPKEIQWQSEDILTCYFGDESNPGMLWERQIKGGDKYLEQLFPPGSNEGQERCLRDNNGQLET
ncbi:hypothetical protein R1sor_001592 [Riccia sorocarpa]|uniref:Reverse transcriptase domain-containing protein n=1 Tax=Riccia sorocarpa TaxID=122646 RepID=A0ABD3GZI8_9MARC